MDVCLQLNGINSASIELFVELLIGKVSLFVQRGLSDSAPTIPRVDSPRSFSSYLAPAARFGEAMLPKSPG